MKKIINSSQNDFLIIDLGLNIEAESEYVVATVDYPKFANSEDLFNAIVNEDLVYNDGTNNLGGSDAIDHLRGYQQKVTLDSDGSPIQRVKTTKSGWHYQPHWLEITTAKKINGFYNKNKEGNDLGFVTYKLFDVNGDEIIMEANEGNAVKTIITWEPNYDYEIIASKIFQSSAPASDVRVWVQGVPDVPYAYGGSRIFAEGGINLKLLGVGAAADTDGRSSKLLTYSAVYHTNKFEITIKHDAGVQHTFAILWEIYKA